MNQRKWYSFISACLALMLLLNGSLIGTAQGQDTGTSVYQPTLIYPGGLLPIGDGVVEVQLSTEWRAVDWDRNANAYYFQNGKDEDAIYLLIVVDTAQWIFFHIMNKRESCFDNPKAFLEKVRDELTARNRDITNPYVLKEIEPIKIGPLNGYELQGEGPVIDSNKLGKFYHHAAVLPDGRILFIALYGNNIDELKVRSAFSEIENNLVVHVDRIPTPYPLLITATALQHQICALTPTP